MAQASGIKPTGPSPVDTTTNLVLYNVDTKEKATLLNADDKTLYSAAGWAPERDVHLSQDKVHVPVSSLQPTHFSSGHLHREQ